MADLNLRSLKVFVTVATSQNLGKAADELCLTRGAVSVSLKTLEESLDVLLFERQAQRLILNSAGMQLLPQAHELLAKAQQLQSLFKRADALPPLRLGASRTIGNYLLPDLLANKLVGLVQPQIVLANSQQLQQQLHEFQLDVALIESDTLLPGLKRLPWQTDPMCLIASADHPQANQPIGWDWLARQPLILRELQSGSREQFDRHIAPHLPQVNIRYELNSLEAIVAAVAAGAGLSFISKHAAKRALDAKQVVELPLPIAVVRQLWLCFTPSSASLPALLELTQRLQASRG